MCENGFIQNPADYCVHTKQTECEKVILVVWVDDIIIAASNEKVLIDVKKILTARFKMKDLGKLRYFLGIDFEQSDNCVKMSQTKYVEKILKRFDMQDCKPRITPCEQKLDYDVEQCQKIQRSGWQPYLFDYLSFVVSKLSQYFVEPTEQQWTTVKHALRYLKGTSGKTLCYRKCEDDKLGLHAYSDADWAADVKDRRSITGYCVSLCEKGPLISWRSKKQPTVALSTCEAEYMALAATIQECLHLMQFLENMDCCKYVSTKI